NTPFNLRLDNQPPVAPTTFTAVTTNDWLAPGQDHWTHDNTIQLRKRDHADTTTDEDSRSSYAGVGSGIESRELRRYNAPLDSVTNECGAASATYDVVPTGWGYNKGADLTYTDTVGDGCYYYEWRLTD